MKFEFEGKVFRLIALIAIAGFPTLLAGGQQSHGSGFAAGAATSQAAGPSSPAASDLIPPQELAGSLRSTTGEKPLIIQVGFHVLYVQAHIPGSEYIGPGNSAEGIQQLRKRVESLPRTQSIIIYCGCCPWSVCPNLNPAYKELRLMGFKSVKVLYIAQDFGKDWVEKGFPVEKEK
jgi:thiosulfate/3-mercaptopyruvate sulfurtransferase